MISKVKLLFDVLGPRVLARFRARCEHPMAEQARLLHALLQENADTEMGRRHDFRSIESFSGFQKQIPPMEYSDIEPYVEASRHGRPAQLTRARPVFYAMTSGTTGPSKYIPVTEASRRAKSHLMRLWLAPPMTSTRRCAATTSSTPASESRDGSRRRCCGCWRPGNSTLTSGERSRRARPMGSSRS